MAEKLLKKKAHKVSPPKTPEEQAKKAVLVGTYKTRQLAWIKRHGVYNYPVKSGDEFDEKAFASIKELWLYADVKGTRHVFEAEFSGKMTRAEFLAANSTYSKLGPSANKAYYVFKTKFLEYGPQLEDPIVIARTADFGGRSAKVKKAIEQFKKDGEFAPLAHYLPSDLAMIPASQLRVCEAAVQLELWSLMQSHSCGPIPPLIFGDPQKQSLIEALAADLPKTKECFTHVDCFSGVGGFCTGLHAAGFVTKVAIEKVKSCVETYSANHTGVHVINKDIRNVSAEEILPYCPRKGIDLVTSGMPCETFSTAGNTSRSFYDDRQFLFREGIRIAKIVNAKFLLFENVPGITSKTASKGGNDLIVDILKEEMSKAGYGNFIEIILDAARFGVPQKRKRFFILGTRLPKILLRRPISRLSRTFTVSDALEGLPPVIPNSWQEGECYLATQGDYAAVMRSNEFWHRGHGETQRITYHMPMKHRPATLERFGRLEQGESLRDLFSKYSGCELEALQSRHVLPKKVFIKRNYRLPSGEPSPTVTSHCLDEFVHPVENRALTVRECARLQSFPDSYDFAGGPYIVPHINRDVQDKYEQIGDAVPPLLAYAWGKTIIEMLIEVNK